MKLKADNAYLISTVYTFNTTVKTTLSQSVNQISPQQVLENQIQVSDCRSKLVRISKTLVIHFLIKTLFNIPDQI